MMTNAVRCALLGGMLACLGFGAVHTDPRQEPITRDALVSAIRRIPLSAPEQEQLIVRARNSLLLHVAELEYQRLLRSHPRSARANFLVGATAFTYRMALVARYAGPSLSDAEGTARRCLKRAIEIDPRDPAPLSLYGLIVWLEDHDFAKGTEMLRRAVRLDSARPQSHLLLGAVLANPSGPNYAPREAEHEFKEAARLDAAYVPPHYMLQILYLGLGRKREAKEEEAAWNALLPAGVDPKRVGHIY